MIHVYWFALSNLISLFVSMLLLSFRVAHAFIRAFVLTGRRLCWARVDKPLGIFAEWLFYERCRMNQSGAPAPAAGHLTANAQGDIPRSTVADDDNENPRHLTNSTFSSPDFFLLLLREFG